jgi:hypothetical protein
MPEPRYKNGYMLAVEQIAQLTADLAKAQARAKATAIENAELRAAADAIATRGHAILAISPWNAARLCFLCYQASHTHDCPRELFRLALEAYRRLRGGRAPEGESA